MTSNDKKSEETQRRTSSRNSMFENATCAMAVVGLTGDSQPRAKQNSTGQGSPRNKKIEEDQVRHVAAEWLAGSSIPCAKQNVPDRVVGRRAFSDLRSLQAGDSTTQASPSADTYEWRTQRKAADTVKGPLPASWGGRRSGTAKTRPAKLLAP